MPAQSRAQQKFMGMVHSTQQGEEPASPEVGKVAKSIDPSDAEDFASTKHKGLPGHAPKDEGSAMNRLRELVRTQVEHAVFERKFVDGMKTGVRDGSLEEAGPGGRGGGFKSLVKSLAAQEGVELCRHDFKEMAEQNIRDSRSLASFISKKRGKE